MTQAKATRTGDYRLDEIGHRECLDDVLTAMGKDINERIKELFAELKPGQRMISVSVRWDNIPERLTNPDKKIGYWAVFALREDEKP